jgi:alkylation response protein AidB-like acyl-CoA dehydrogenase
MGAVGGRPALRAAEETVRQNWPRLAAYLTQSGMALKTEPEPRQRAAFAIIMAKMDDGTATMLLADMNQPGVRLDRLMDSLDSCFTGGHGVLQFENLRVPASDVLGEIGKCFGYAGVRLAPARLTHCMRWLGQARRAHDVALAYARKRQAFGKRWASTNAWAS